MVIKLDYGVPLDNSFLSELSSGGLYSWKRGCRRVWAVLPVGLWVRALRSSLCVPGRGKRKKEGG